MPRKLSEVSAMIIAGIASVTEAMIWLVKLGTRWRVMMRISLVPSSRAAITKGSLRQDMKRPRTSRASAVQPISEMMRVMMK